MKIPLMIAHFHGCCASNRRQLSPARAAQIFKNQNKRETMLLLKNKKWMG
jgi:hypothetical protein